MKNKTLLSIAAIVFLLHACFAQTVDYSDSTITRPVSYQYHAQFFGRLILGSHYRKVWSAPVTMHYLDLEHMKGGLTPIKKGGGFQTKSLRLMGADSNLYVIRSVDKDPSKTVGKAFQNTVVTSLIQDQISASHPYGALVAPPLSDAAGIYHTNPQMLYVPDDPKLGEFRNDFKGMVVLFEEKSLISAQVDTGLSGFKKVKDTWEVYSALHKSNLNFVDQRFMLRSRLFDMMIGDWDRHEGQWLFAQFNLANGGKMFRPIPLDRDEVFFNFDGILPTYASLNVLATRKMQHYRPMPFSVKWFNFNARYVDHNFLNELDHNAWRQIADSLMFRVTNEDIDNAFKVWPDTIFKLTGPEIVKTLKERRDNLPLIADKQYAFLAKHVNVVGSDTTEYFDVKRLLPNFTDVSVYQWNNGVKGNLTYHRTFVANETHEIRLYGLGNNDVFHVTGKSNANTKLRIIGGPGADTFIDSSRVGGTGKRTKIYDTKEGNNLSLGKEASNKTSKDTLFNSYSTNSYDYNGGTFAPMFGYNADDGFYLGASYTLTTQEFHKRPYASRQTIGGDAAFNTGAFNFLYRGDFTNVIGKLDFNLQANIQAPNYRQNFFGFGNETVIDSTISGKYYRFRINRAYVFPSLEVGDDNKIRFLFGPVYSQAAITGDTSTYADIYSYLTADNFSRKHYGGINTQLIFDPSAPDSMAHFQARFLVNDGYQLQLEDNTVHYAYVNGYISFYLHFYNAKGKRALTLATRFGGGTNFGDFEFYQSNVIGGRTGENVRGFLGERYSGRTALYNNLEARLLLFHFNAYIFPADFGILGLLDNGEVFMNKGEVGYTKSTTIHTGYGGGIWFSPFGLATISVTDAFSIDEPKGLINLKLGWWF